MEEGKEIFLKVDSVEPVLKGGGICSRERYLDGINVWIGSYGYFFPCDRYTVCDPDVVREDGCRQAFSLFKELYDMPQRDRREAFGKVTLEEIFRDATYDDLAKKLDAWKEEKKIRIKDEVQHKPNGEKAVVLNIMDGFIYAVTKKKAFITCAPIGDYKKTGVHVDDLDAYLEV